MKLLAIDVQVICFPLLFVVAAGEFIAHADFLDEKVNTNTLLCFFKFQQSFPKVTVRFFTYSLPLHYVFLFQ
jgi:hypothetical protein